MKPKRLANFWFPYVVLVSKFIEYFCVDVEDELEESTGTMNHISCLNLHKNGLYKGEQLLDNIW